MNIFIKSLFVVSISTVTVIEQTASGKSPNDLPRNTCKVNCHGIIRTLPSTFCYQLDCFKEANATDILLKPELYTRNTLLLYGPPGTGKSTLAEIFWQSIPGANLVKLHAPSLVTVEQGSGAANIKMIFEEAKRAQCPTVIIIEEVDSIANVSGSKLNRSEDRRAVYQELNNQLDSIQKNAQIFVICTSNYAEQCANEFLSRFEHIKVGYLSDTERLTAFKYLFYHSEQTTLKMENIYNFLSNFSQKIQGQSQLEVAQLVKSFHELEISIKQTSLDHFDKNIKLHISNSIMAIQQAILVCEQQYTTTPALIEHEIKTLKFLIGVLELKSNTYSLITESDWIIKKLVQNTTQHSLRFMKHLVNDILLHAQRSNNGVVSMDLISSRLRAYESRLRNNNNNLESTYEEWQDEMLRLHRVMLVSQIAIQGAGTAGTLAIQGIAHGSEVIQAAQTVCHLASTHLYVAGGIAALVAAGTIYSGYKIYKWVEGEPKKGNPDKPGH